MIINEPKLNFANTKRAFQQYAEEYNVGKESRERLKPSHFAQFYVYVRLLQRNMAQSNTRALNSGHHLAMAISTDMMPHVFTNNTEMRKQLDGGHHSTFIRRYERLHKAGVVKKINHGPTNNYEIIINPYLLFISDLSGQPNTWRPNLEKAQTWLSQLDSDNNSIAKCEQNIVSLNEHFNKKIIHQAESSGGNSLPLNPTELPPDDILNYKKDTPKDTTENVAKSDFGATVLSAIKNRMEGLIEKNVAPPEKLTKKERAARKNAEFKKLRVQYAVMLVQLMIDAITEGITIYASERKRAISYVAEHYFGQCFTYVSLERNFAEYTRRIEDARRFKEQYPNYHPTPLLYFNVDYDKGFNSPKWKANKIKWDKLKQNSREQRILMAVIRRINDKQTYNQYQLEIKYVEKHIPSKLKQYFAIIHHDYPHILKQPKTEPELTQKTA